MMRRVRHVTPVALVSLSLVLAGCIGADTGTGAPPALTPQASAPSPAAEPRVATNAAPVIDPTTLVGMPSGAVQAKLGNPSLLRRDGTAQIWQYRGQGCIVDLFLYRRGDGDAQVAFVDMRGPRVDEGQGAACVSAMAVPGQQAALNRS